MVFRIWGKRSDKSTDEELLAGFISSGDLEILGELYSRYMHLVYGVCLRYLKDRDDSKDAVMQIFEKLVSELPRQKVENFRPWLYVITRNYCLMKIRSGKSENEKFREWINDPDVFMEYDDHLHPIDNDGQDMEKDLEECIKRLKDQQRECINLFYYENKSYSDIAGDLGLDEKKVKSHLQNAKRNLKICLEEKQGERKE
jgi:RNA polymerase sigma-70 factor (ECF subfamily)